MSEFESLEKDFKRMEKDQLTSLEVENKELRELLIKIINARILKMKTLQQYLHENIEKGIIDFSIRAEVVLGGLVKFYIHPEGTDGETLDFLVDENVLLPVYGRVEIGEFSEVEQIKCATFNPESISPEVRKKMEDEFEKAVKGGGE